MSIKLSQETLASLWSVKKGFYGVVTGSEDGQTMIAGKQTVRVATDALAALTSTAEGKRVYFTAEGEVISDKPTASNPKAAASSGSNNTAWVGPRSAVM